MSDEWITFRCLEVVQPIGTFYIGAMDSSDLLSISYADIRRLEERDIERYLGIQRTLRADRVAEIADYARTVDATFPTSVILAVESEHAEYNDARSVMRIRQRESIAKIIDGQHRIAGLKGYSGPQFMVNVAIFVDMDIEDQATVFATINLAQTKVSKSLVYDLYEYARARSPQKTAHNVARVLNREPGSPFLHKIKILGQATPGREETITQAAFVEALLPYISTDLIKDRDALKRGEPILRVQPGRTDGRFLRNMFIDERDADITVILWNYFAAVQERWPYAWNTKEAGNILNRTTGFSGLMKFLPVAYAAYRKPEAVPTKEFFGQILAAVPLKDSDFNPELFPPGGSGTSKLARTLVAETEAIRTTVVARGKV